MVSTTGNLLQVYPNSGLLFTEFCGLRICGLRTKLLEFICYLGHLA